MKLDAFQTYCLFMALRSHFTQANYDYFKYNGKIRATKDSFMTNRDRFKYSKLSRSYDDSEMTDFLVSNFIKGKKWIGDFLEDDADENYRDYLKRKQSFTYIFQNEVSKLFSDDDPKDIFSIKDSQYPKILEKYFEGDLSIEVLAVLNTLINFSDKFDSRLGKDDIVWSKISFLIQKIKPFLQYDKTKVKQILKECVS